MVRIYGCSDDLVEIEGSNYTESEIDCWNKEVLIVFSDGTIIRIGYSKPDIAVWYINIENQGSAKSKLTICDDEDAEIYSDIFEIDAEIVTHRVL